MGRTLSILKKRKDFVRIAQDGRKFVTSGLVLQALKRPDDNPFGDGVRVGFVTTKKLGNAVKRNRIRRRLRALAREFLPQMAQPQSDYVLIGRVVAYDRKFSSLQSDLKRALKEI